MVNTVMLDFGCKISLKNNIYTKKKKNSVFTTDMTDEYIYRQPALIHEPSH